MFMSSGPESCSQSLPYSTYALQVPFKMTKICILADAFSCALWWDSQLNPINLQPQHNECVGKVPLGICSLWLNVPAKPSKQLPVLGLRVAFAHGLSWLLADR